MSYTPEYLPIRTVCKFYANHDPKHPNKLFTRSLLKIGFIHHDWLDDNADKRQPQDGEFWQVDVVQETCPGANRGCFLLHPVEYVEPGDLARLLPGMYQEENQGGCLIVKPNYTGYNWIIPLRHRHAISPKDDVSAPYAIVVSV